MGGEQAASVLATKSADYSYDENVADAMRLGTLLKTINLCPKPTIALVHGSVFGGGVGLTAACDIAIAAPDTIFCLSEVRIGLIPSIIAPYVLAAMGERQARRYFMTAERFDAATAHRIGFVHETGDIDAIGEKIIKALMDGAPTAQTRGKKLILEIAQKPIDEAMIKLTATQNR
jgi:methylglutaconyl-CoA hydratase